MTLGDASGETEKSEAEREGGTESKIKAASDSNAYTFGDLDDAHAFSSSPCSWTIRVSNNWLEESALAMHSLPLPTCSLSVILCSRRPCTPRRRYLVDGSYLVEAFPPNSTTLWSFHFIVLSMTCCCVFVHITSGAARCAPYVDSTDCTDICSPQHRLPL